MLHLATIALRRLAQPRIAVAFAAVVIVLIIPALILTVPTHQDAGGAATEVAMVVALLVVGVVVAYRQPTNAMGWILLGIALFFVINGAASEYSVYTYRMHHGVQPLGALAVLLQPSWAPAIMLMGLAIFLFPDAHLPPGRWRLVLWAFLGIGALWMFGAFTIAAATIASHHVEVNHGGDLLIIDHATGAARIWAAVQDVFFPVLGLSAVSCLVRQTLVFRHASGERRQQLKWLVAGGAVFLISAAVSLGTANSNQPVKYALNFISGIGLLALPICIGVGVLKYGLFEIDRIVSRTLSYAIVTALLVATYVGLVALTTQALPISSPVGVATGTLAAAALFNPLRRRVQRIVDHRFNRARYDAEATVAAFAARLRDAVDLETTERELLDAVRLVVAPSDVTIWLKQS